MIGSPPEIGGVEAIAIQFQNFCHQNSLTIITKLDDLRIQPQRI